MLTLTAALVISGVNVKAPNTVTVVIVARTLVQAHRLGNVVNDVLTVKSGDRTRTLTQSPDHTPCGTPRLFKAGESLTVPSIPTKDSWTLNRTDLKVN